MTTLAQYSDASPMWPTLDESVLTAALSYATVFVQEYCGQQFTYATDTVTLSVYSGQAYLPELPVGTVSAVSALLPTADESTWTFQPLTQYRVRSNGIIELPAVAPYLDVATWGAQSWGWIDGPDRLQVTYTHGYGGNDTPVIPDGLTQACAAIAGVYATNPDRKVEKKVGVIANRWSPVPYLDPMYVAILDRYRVPVL